MWTAKKPEMKCRRTLRTPGQASKNAFTVGNRHHPEVTPGRGRRREAGGSRGCPAPTGGPRCQTAGQPAGPVPDQARSPPSHTRGGPSLRLRGRRLPGNPVVTAFLELPLEFGVRGPVRLVPFPVGSHCAVVRLRERLLGFLRRALQGSWQFTGSRRAAPPGSRHAISFSRLVVWPTYPGQSPLYLDCAYRPSGFGYGLAGL